MTLRGICVSLIRVFNLDKMYPEREDARLIPCLSTPRQARLILFFLLGYTIPDQKDSYLQFSSESSLSGQELKDLSGI